MIKIFAKGVHYHETFLLYPSDLETVARAVCQGRFRLNIRFFFSTGRVVRHSNELKMFNRTLDVALGVWFRCDYGGTGLMVGLNLGGLFQPWAL